MFDDMDDWIKWYLNCEIDLSQKVYDTIIMVLDGDNNISFVSFIRVINYHILFD